MAQKTVRGAWSQWLKSRVRKYKVLCTTQSTIVLRTHPYLGKGLTSLVQGAAHGTAQQYKGTRYVASTLRGLKYHYGAF